MLRKGASRRILINIKKYWRYYLLGLAIKLQIRKFWVRWWALKNEEKFYLHTHERIINKYLLRSQKSIQFWCICCGALLKCCCSSSQRYLNNKCGGKCSRNGNLKKIIDYLFLFLFQIGKKALIFVKK